MFSIASLPFYGFDRKTMALGFILGVIVHLLDCILFELQKINK